MRPSRRVRFACIAALLVASAALIAAPGGAASITVSDLKDWLGYIASDQLEGRAVFSTGIGLAAAYIESHLAAWGVTPAGDDGTYLQTVRVHSVNVVSRSTLTVRVHGVERTFADGQGVTFPRNMGGRQRLTIDRVVFAGYGLDVPTAGHEDFRGRDVSGAAVVWLGARGPKGFETSDYRRILAGRARYATDQLKAAAVLGPEAIQARGSGGAGGSAGAAGAQGGAERPDFVTVERLDRLRPPAVTLDDEVLTFLFSQAPESYAELRRRAEQQDALPFFTLDQVSLTFDVDADYSILRTQYAQNVVGIVDGSDPALKRTYVAFGAHYDHVGYAQNEVKDGRRPAAPGRVSPGALDDRIWNGADDDGSGTVALMALARAFAQGPRPRRSLLFVWHTGEERGLYGSRYFTEFPEVPLDAIVAQLNIDMIGRNRDDKSSEANTVYAVGSDRISTELDSVLQQADADLRPPLTISYEMNDPSDPEQVYYRSDHYSYAAKGIPIIFFTTGLHPDYHANTDEVSKIQFDKLARVVRLVYETGARVANLDHPPVRDNRGPRKGRADAEGAVAAGQGGR
jgi:Peptidase family M28